MERGGAATEARGSRPPAFAPFRAKLTPPVAPIPVVERPRLLDDLLAFRGRLAIISAPAGYGKSILAAQWAAADPRPTAWLSLDPADNDPHLLLTYLALATGSPPVPGLTEDAPLDDVLALLRARLAARGMPGIMVLDDAQVIDGPAAEVIATIAANVPDGSVLVVLTREPPSLPTARGVMRGDIKVVDAAELAMTLDEATRMLCSSGISDIGAVAEILNKATEGWAAGLYLASLALQDDDDPLEVAQALSGRHRRIVDFFTEEVLPSIEPEDLEFMLDTAVLDRCCGELCDTVLERHDSRAVLERLTRTNRFVIPLDQNGEWYRYHHLFGEMLVAEARRRDAAMVTRVATRASEWWEARFEPDAAVTLALLAPDRRRAVELIGRWSPFLQSDRRRMTVERWLAAFPDDEVLHTPTLAVTAAWNAALVGDTDAVRRFLGSVERSADDAPSDGPSPRAAADLLRALTTSDGLHVLVTHAESAFTGHAASSPYRAVASHFVAGGHLMLGDAASAVPYIDAAIGMGRAGLPPAEAQALATLARLRLMQGDVAEARRAVDDAIALVDEHWLPERPTIGFVYAIATLVHATDGSADLATAERCRATALLDRLDGMSPFHAVSGYLECAESALRTGDVDEATDLLAEADRRLRRLRDTGLLPFALERVGSAVSSATARPAVLVEPLSPAELRVLAYLPTHLSFGEIGEELFVSRNTVKSHAMAIYRKLGVTSRSAAVKEAANLDLFVS